MAAGAIVGLQGLSRMSLPGLLQAAIGGYLVYRGSTGQCAVYQSLGLDTYHTDGRAPADEITEKGVHVEQSMLIQKSAEELYAFWRNFENLPRIMTHVESVKRTDDRRSHWVAKVNKPVGTRVEWDAETTADEPNTRIGWRSVPGSQVETLGEVRFEKAPGDRGTYVHASMSYVPPGGKLGHLLAWIFDETPQAKMREKPAQLQAAHGNGRNPDERWAIARHLYRNRDATAKSITGVAFGQNIPHHPSNERTRYESCDLVRPL